MRTKTLVLAAAAFAAGALTTMAQSNVYSLNIVGYIQQPIAGGGQYSLLANPFDDGNGNQLTNLLASLPKQSIVLIWDNSSSAYVSANKTAGGWTANFAIPEGTGFFVKNGSATAPALTNMFVGSENVSNNVVIPAGYSLIGSPLAYSGDLTTDTNINLGSTLAKQSILLRWDVPTQGYQSVNKTAGGWTGSLNVGAGEGFFVKVNAPTNWVQVLQ